ncbi:hypothetical protein PanWU01x14_090510, partial [Parasponia andersonii]
GGQGTTAPSCLDGVMPCPTPLLSGMGQLPMQGGAGFGLILMSIQVYMSE